MRYPARIKWLEGRFANVDGIPFQMPIRTQRSPALFAAFPIDATKAEQLIPGDELHAWSFRGRGLLVVAVVNYLDTTIGRYVEFCLGILATRGPSPTGALRPLLFRSRHETGVYIYDLPVSSEISVKGGLGIWGMPKRQANLDFVVSSDVVTSQYDLDGKLVARIDIPRPRNTWFPARVSGVGWGADFRGQMTKSYTYAGGRMGFHVRPSAARLTLGDHPRAERLKELDVEPRAVFSGFMPMLDGVLDDHVESWYLTTATPTGQPERGLSDLTDLTLSEQWLEPPDRDEAQHQPTP